MLDWGWTGLMYAAADGKVEMVQLLLEHKAQSNVQGDREDTVLTLAAFAARIFARCCFWQVLINKLKEITRSLPLSTLWQEDFSLIEHVDPAIWPVNSCACIDGISFLFARRVWSGTQICSWL